MLKYKSLNPGNIFSGAFREPGGYFRMVQAILAASKKVIGLKQTIRALHQGRVEKVFYAADTEEHLIRRVAPVCEEFGVPILPLKLSQKELGKLCQIEVGAAIVAIVRD
jgi:large subunit ribosomal protein L7A